MGQQPRPTACRLNSLELFVPTPNYRAFPSTLSPSQARGTTGTRGTVVALFFPHYRIPAAQFLRHYPQCATTTYRSKFQMAMMGCFGKGRATTVQGECSSNPSLHATQKMLSSPIQPFRRMSVSRGAPYWRIPPRKTEVVAH